MLPNPSFEGGYVEGLARGWALGHHWGWRKVACEQETPRPRSGPSAQKITCTEFWAGRALLAAAGPRPTRLKAGESYEVSVWVRADRPMGTVELLALDATGPEYEIAAGHVFAVGREWQHVRLRFHAAKQIPRATVGISFAQEGVLWVDDASWRQWAGPDKSVPVKEGNLVHNGSFELGLEGWLPVGFRQVQLGARARRGRKSLRVECRDAGGEIQSIPLRATPCREHVLSLSLLADPPRKAVRIGIACGQPGRPRMAFDRKVEAGKPWERFAVKGSLPAAPGDQYFVRILPGPGQGKLWVDTVQITEGSQATPFRLRSPFHVTLAPSRSDPFYGPGEAVTITATCHDHTLRIVELPLQVTVLDAWDREVDRQNLRVEAKPGLVHKTLQFAPKGRTGTFRMSVQDPTKRNNFPKAETIFAVLPQGAAPRPAGHATFGVRLAAADWDRSLGPDSSPEWARTRLGAGDESFPLAHKRLEAWLSSGADVLVAFDSAPCWAAQLPRRQVPEGRARLSQCAGFQGYVRAMVRRHRGRVRAWAFAAQADRRLYALASQPNAYQYATLLRAGYMALKKVNPSATAAACCSTHEEPPGKFVQRIMGLAGRHYADVILYQNESLDEWTNSRHLAQIRRVLSDYAVSWPVWASSRAAACRLIVAHVSGPRPLTRTRETPLERAAGMVRGIVARRAAGVSRSFLDATTWDSPQLTDAHTSAPGADDWRMYAQPALALAIALLDGAVYTGPVEVADVRAFAFRKGSARLVALWSIPTAMPPVKVRLRVEGPTDALDMMGNRIAGASKAGKLRLTVGREPVYVTTKKGQR